MRIQKPKDEGNKYPVFLAKEPKGFIVIPSFPDITKVDVTYPLIEPFAYAKISWDPEGRKLIYRVVEPAMEGDDIGTMKKIEEGLMEVIDVKMSVLKNRMEAIQYLQSKIQKVLDDMNMKLSNER